MSDKTRVTRATSQAKAPASPDPLVDRLFERMATMYGAKWLDLWTGIPLDAVKADWGRRLIGVPAEAVATTNATLRQMLAIVAANRDDGETARRTRRPVAVSASSAAVPGRSQSVITTRSEVMPKTL